MSTTEETSSTTSPNDEGSPLDMNLVLDALLAKKPWADVESVLKKCVPGIVLKSATDSGMNSFNVLLLLDQSNPMGEEHADRIYEAIAAEEEKKDLLLVLGSRGGEIEPAYLIAKNCKAAAQSRFVVSVPRRAKSAATLIALGADEIHLGSMSELGPIDPQLGRVPALALTNALQTIAKLVSEHPGSSEMFAKFLSQHLDLRMLGYFERINESAVQYASRLLSSKSLPNGLTALDLAAHLVNHYKDHSFVIDKDEALQLLGANIVKVQTPEYKFANAADQSLRLISRFCKWFYRKQVTFVGSAKDCIRVRDLEDQRR